MPLKIESVPSVPTQTSAENPHTLDALPILVIYAHSSCNCRCVMCDIWKTRDAKTFTAADLERQLPSLRRLGVRWVVFSGGEPLMNPELPELCRLLRPQGIRTTLLTTGLLLEKRAPEVANSFDDVIVSVDGPPAIHDAIRRVKGAFHLISTGVEALRAIRPGLPISARSTVQKANHGHLRETARAAFRLGLNSISFLPVDLTSPAFNRSLAWPVSQQTEIGVALAEISALENEVESLIREAANEFPPGFLAESPGKLRRIVRHFRAQLGLLCAESPTCNAPWVSAVIETDGTIRPCFFHSPVGKLNGKTLEEVVNGRTAIRFRENLDIPNNPTCRNCVCSLNYHT
jgi:MoaA/NifB/PqqE/SkfB family radical SAM enzyme